MEEPLSPAPHPPELAIWHAAARDLSWAAARVHLLDSAERGQSAAFADDAPARPWFNLGRVLRRVALEAYTGWPARAWRFEATSMGMPVASCSQRVTRSVLFNQARPSSMLASICVS